MKPLNESTLIICSIVRDAAKGLKRNIPIINALCHYVKDYKIIVYENNSQDQTKAILREWQQNIGEQHLFVSMTDIENATVIPSERNVNVNRFFSERRIQRMVELRNQYMDHIATQKLEADYLIVVDLDVAKLYLEGILSSFTLMGEWDAVTANGYSLSPKFRKRYHDTYALTEWGKENIPQNEKLILENSCKYGNIKKGNMPIRVFSAFGGLAIYHFNAVKGLRYQLFPNDDDRVEVKCEHFSLCSQMVNRGFDRVCINPSMNLKYQSLDWKIIMGTLKRWLCLYS